MDGSSANALSTLLTIFVGVLLRQKLPPKGEPVKVVKAIVLSCLLPATIFIALLSLKPSLEALLWPVGALVFNFLMLAITRVVLALILARRLTKATDLDAVALELCSLSPGLSSFGFIYEFCTPEVMGLIAFADLGNKMYGIVFSKFLGLAAMRSAHKKQYYHHRDRTKSNEELVESSEVQMYVESTEEMTALFTHKDILSELFCEPITCAMILGLVLASTKTTIEELSFIGHMLSRLKDMCGPTLLIFVGIKIQVPDTKMLVIFLVLIARAGAGLLYAAGTIAAFQLGPSPALGWVLFLQSSCSFWPFASMTAIHEFEEKLTTVVRTFNLEVAISFVSLSFPVSISLCLLISVASGFFIVPINSAIVGASLLVAGSTGAAILSRFNLNVTWPCRPELPLPVVPEAISPRIPAPLLQKGSL